MDLMVRTETVIRAMLDRIEAGEFGDARALAQEQAQLRRVWAVATQERHNVERLRIERGADVHYAPLDLARARDEIGRRLARLRGEDGAGGVPGGAE